MIIESARILLGVALVCFHVQIAEFMYVREQELTAFFGRRGVRMPAFSSLKAVREVYFWLGVVTLLIAVGRLWVPA